MYDYKWFNYKSGKVKLRSWTSEVFRQGYAEYQTKEPCTELFNKLLADSIILDWDNVEVAGEVRDWDKTNAALLLRTDIDFQNFVISSMQFKVEDTTDLIVKEADKPSGKIKSNGLSSSYYDLPISDKLLEALNKRKEDGQCYVKTEELIDELFDGLFNQGTLFKSLVRAHLQTKGEGKAGNDLEYEINKVIYYANKIKEKGCE